MSRGLAPAGLGRVHDVLARHVEGGIPGLVGLVRRGDDVHVEALGTLAAGGGGAVRRDAIFRIASMTKPVTAAAAMMLVEDCVVRLDDPVDRFLPELADRRVLRSLDGPLDDTVLAERAITLRDLLTFRMGFGIPMVPPGTYPIQRAIDALALGQGPPRPATPPAPDEWLRRFGTLPLMHQPGARWMYHTASDVLGVLVARAAGCPLEDFLRERLFEPLGMRDTGFSVPPGAIDRLATSYWTNPATGTVEVFDAAAGGEWSRSPAFPSGGGGLVSTADDYLAFAEMLLADGRRRSGRILSRATVALMTQDHLTPAQKAASAFVPGWFDRFGWGFGVSVVTRRDDVAKSVGTYGWDGGLGTSWFTDPREDLIVVLLTQRAWTSPNPPPVFVDFWTAVYRALDD